MLDFVRGRRLSKTKVLSPFLCRICEMGIDVGAVKDIARAAGIKNAVGRHRECGLGSHRAGLVIPEEAAFSESHAANPTAPSLQIFEHCSWAELHLLAEALCHDSHIDEGKQLVRVRPDTASVKRRENPGIPTEL